MRRDVAIVSADREAAPFLRRHQLSPEAIAYKARRKPSVPIQMPDFSDRAAVARWRAETNALWGEDDNPEVPHQQEMVGGVACLVAGPTTADGSPNTAGPAVAAGPSVSKGTPTVVYAHGGGYVLGSAAVAIPITARLAQSLPVVSVDYRQPPQHPFPAALDDVLAVYQALSAAGTPVALAGDSSGGALALSAAVTMTAANLRPAAVALFSPLLDHVSVPGNPLADDEGRRLIDHYVGDADPADPRLSPLRAELSGLPPVLVQAAAGEPLAAQAHGFQHRATAAGVDVTLDLWDGMWHTWHYHALPEADEALAEAAGFVAASL